MARQPEEQIRYTECFVAFIDLLGFKSLVKESEDDPAMIATLVSALNRIVVDTPQYTHTRARRDEHEELVGYDTCVLQTRPFSDCICLFAPTSAGRLSWLLSSIRYVHDRMLELGVCVRGAVTIGGMYWDPSWGADVPELQRKLRDQQFRTFGQQPPQEEPNEQPDSNVLYEASTTGFPITLGPALVEAYELERDVAVYPRVIASDGLKQYLETEGSAPAFPLASPSPSKCKLPVNNFFRTHCDGCFFVDLLHPDIDRNDTERIVRTTGDDGSVTMRWERRGNTHAEVLANVHRLVESSLSRRDCPKKIRAKYEWLRSYADSAAGDGSS